ncbi:MAG TPA: hypothetical protein VGF27_13170 [Pseudoduganella sp.]
MRQLEYCLPVAFALLLAACGGGNDGGMGPLQVAGVSGIAVGEPTPAALNRDEFIKLARGASCSDIRNRLFIIDDKQVFWDKQGNCPDNGYSRTLYGRTAADVQCVSNDSIAGPQTSCSNTAMRPLFDTMLQNLDKADLGLGGAHKVEQVEFLPKDGVAATQPLLREGFSGLTSPLNVAVRDPDSFLKLWSAHYQYRSDPPAAPKIDFTRQMVLGVFLGNRPGGCIGATIDKVEVRAGKVVAYYTERDYSGPTVLCVAAITQPMDMVVLDKIEGDVSFIKQ